MTSAQCELCGLSRVTAPALFASGVLPKVIAAYIAKFPKVIFELLADDAKLDLISDSVDIAIRAGKLEDSSLIAKKLGDVYFATYAQYKESCEVEAPEDLLEYRCIQFSRFEKEEWIFFNSSKNKVVVPMSGQLLLNEVHTVKSLALNGIGIALLPNFICGDEIKEKELVRVLPDWKTELRCVSPGYPAQKFVSPTLSCFITYAGDLIREHLKRVEQNR